MDLQQTKQLLATTPREVVCELAEVSPSYLTELLNGTKPAVTLKAKITLRIAKEVAQKVQTLKEEVKEQFKVLEELNELVED
jgi:hypothetical protein